ncbi:Cell division protein FtsQ [Streptomyces violaceorubidus]
MAGPTTAERGARQQESSGPPRTRRFRPPRLRTIIILAVALVCVAGGTVWVLYGSNWTRLEQVSVSGTRVLTPAQVREAADVPVGDPLVSVDTEAVEARLRRKMPRIDEVEVERSWPHGIGLKVTERTPVLITQKGRNFVEVDDEGVRFATVSKAPKGVPVLELELPPVPAPPPRVCAASTTTAWCARRCGWPAGWPGRPGHTGRQGPFLRRHLAGVERRPDRVVGER